MASITVKDIADAAASGVLGAKLGSTGPTVAVALQRSYNALVALTDSDRVDELADRIVAKLGTQEGVSVDAAVVKQAVKDALVEGIDS